MPNAKIDVTSIKYNSNFYPLILKWNIGQSFLPPINKTQKEGSRFNRKQSTQPKQGLSIQNRSSSVGSLRPNLFNFIQTVPDDN